MKYKKTLILLIIILVVMILPENPRIPVQEATVKDWNANSFWYEPWGKSGVHKGIDIFGKKGTPVLSTTYGIVVFKGELPLGGNVVLVLGPKWRLHYYAHLQKDSVFIGKFLSAGASLGTLGDTGNAKGKPAHLHYSVITLLPYIWRADSSTQGWKKIFFLDPHKFLTRDKFH